MVQSHYVCLFSTNDIATISSNDVTGDFKEMFFKKGYETAWRESS
jgi:hypothetical protein